MFPQPNVSINLTVPIDRKRMSKMRVDDRYDPKNGPNDNHNFHPDYWKPPSLRNLAHVE